MFSLDANELGINIFTLNENEDYYELSIKEACLSQKKDLDLNYIDHIFMECTVINMENVENFNTFCRGERNYSGIFPRNLAKAEAVSYSLETAMAANKCYRVRVLSTTLDSRINPGALKISSNQHSPRRTH